MKRIIGIIGKAEEAIQVEKALANPKTGVQSLGKLTSIAHESLFPQVKGNLVTETHIRKLANKLGYQIPVQKYAGRAVETQQEANEFFATIASQYAGDDWEAKYFLETDFFRKGDGAYTMVVEPKNTASLKRRLGDEYIELALLAEGEEKPSGVKYTLTVGDSAGAVLQGKVNKVLAQINKDIKESERK